MREKPTNRHIIVIGTSAGGVDALLRLVRSLPADLPAAVFVVLHLGEHSRLSEVLNTGGTLHAAAAVDGGAIRVGRIYVAPPGSHTHFAYETAECGSIPGRPPRPRDFQRHRRENQPGAISPPSLA